LERSSWIALEKLENRPLPKKIADPICVTAQSRTRTILDHGKLSEGWNSWAAAFGVEI